MVCAFLSVAFLNWKKVFLSVILYFLDIVGSRHYMLNENWLYDSEAVFLKHFYNNLRLS